jgi:hypothetical protein
VLGDDLARRPTAERGRREVREEQRVGSVDDCSAFLVNARHGRGNGRPRHGEHHECP